MDEKEKVKQLREVNAVVKRLLADFVGRELTPTLIAEAEGVIRSRLDEMVKAGTYVLPDGLVVDKVMLSRDMQIQIYFKRVPLS